MIWVLTSTDRHNRLYFVEVYTSLEAAQQVWPLDWQETEKNRYFAVTSDSRQDEFTLVGTVPIEVE